MLRMSFLSPSGTTAALFAAFLLAPVNAKVVLDAPSDYTTGQALHYAITADVNQDGKPDLIVAANGHLTVLLGNGQAFQNPLNGTTGTYYVLVAGDFNGDGKLDLATEQGVLPGNGDGTFQALLPTPLTNYRLLTAGDVNGDGKLDLVAAGGASGGFQVLTGNGNGTFTSRYSASNPFSEFSAPVLGDFTGDGKRDLTFVGSEGTAWLARGNGDGTFQQRVSLGVASANISLGAGDFNGDGKLDLAVSSASNVRVALGNGNGTFQAPAVLAAGGSYNILVRDLNNDGKLDLFTGNVYYLGLGAGAFSAPVAVQNHLPPDMFGLGRQVDAADFNQDGWADFTAYFADVNTNAVTVFFSKGAGQYRQIPSGPVVPQSPMGMATGDFNRDGKVDAAVISYSGTLSVYLGNNNGTFQAPATYPTSFSSSLSAIRTGDLNRDGNADLILGGGSPAHVQVFLGSASGVFSASQNYSLPAPAVALTSGDFNGDGRVDVISSGGSVLLGNGTGGFTIGPPINLTTLYSTNFIASADFNNDSKLDLALLAGTQGVAVLLGNGDGTFGSPALLPSGPDPQCLTVADLNKDGKMDIVSAERQTNNAYTFLGNGNGTFLSPKISGGFGVAVRLVAVDLDKDGNLDLVGANGSVQDITVLPGKGDGNFQSAIRYQTAGYNRSVLPAEATGDNKQDLLVAASGGLASYLLIVPNISQ